MTTPARRRPLPGADLYPQTGGHHHAVRILVVAAVASLAVAAWAAVGAARSRSAIATARIHNPLQYDGRAFSCPDPDVFNWGTLYVASCTSDYGQDNPLPGGGMGPLAAAFPIYVSADLEHWQFRSFVLPPGRHPAESVAPLGHWPGGRYWSDEIHHFGNYYEAYFSAVLNRGTIAWINQRYHEHLLPGTCGLFVAWTKHLFSEQWRSRLLHFPGQFNRVRGNAPDYAAGDSFRATAAGNSLELKGGVIDPTVARDPRSGRLILAWAKQANLIFVGQLSADGLHMSNQVHLALAARLPWECDPDELGRHCVNEGPVLWWDERDQQMDLFFNADSTWKGTYKIGVAASADLRHWQKYPQPILRSGNGFFGPGIGGQPFSGPNGQLELAFHVQLDPSHDSQARFLAIAPLSFDPPTRSFPFHVPEVGAREPTRGSSVR